ncbi:hypothetical protein GWK47_012290 [Chionoecetes opilio]|uniref:Uncharacterized protein n=1 Tax=Chionoecetes opilio TaxID=41210 RepID=A0A8J4XW68_CHIOP|nr:hypothetical protein GWK47_012290 [Chionoecetes opilio]
MNKVGRPGCAKDLAGDAWHRRQGDAPLTPALPQQAAAAAAGAARGRASRQWLGKWRQRSIILSTISMAISWHNDGDLTSPGGDDRTCRSTEAASGQTFCLPGTTYSCTTRASQCTQVLPSGQGTAAATTLCCTPKATILSP